MGLRAIWLLAAAPLVFGTSCGKVARTQVMLIVDTDLRIPDTIDTFGVRALGPDGTVREATTDLTEGVLPRTLGLAHEGGALGPFLITITAEREQDVIVERQVRFSFREHATRALQVTLVSDCRHASCFREETCGNDGECRAIDIADDEFEPWSPGSDPEDAGAADTAADDAPPE